MISKKQLEKEAFWILRDKYKGKRNPGISKDLARLKSGEPIDYVIGWKPFLNCKIDLSFKPLIPRPETEFWTEKAITAINSKPGKKATLDIFSGSGCIGVAVLKNTKNTSVDFAEKDEDLCKQINLNLKINKVSLKRARVLNSDVLSKVKGKYDFILANPPYIALEQKHRVQKSVLANEPRMALFAKEKGIYFIARLLKQAKKHLSPGGQIWIEFDPKQKKAVEAMAKKEKYISYVPKKDQYGRWRFAVIS